MTNQQLREGKYIAEYPVPIRYIAERAEMRGAHLQSQDLAFIEEQVNILLHSDRERLRKAVEKIVLGLRCETCTEERVFGSPPNSDASNLYVYNDLSGATRCFCKDHMSFTNEGKMAILRYGEKGAIYPCYGAKLLSDILFLLTTNT